MNQPSLTPYISEKEIADRVLELGNEISSRLKDKPLIAICVLRGAFVFYADLIRAINNDIKCEFFGVSSYQNSMKSSGEVKLTLDLSHPIEGKNILLVEDIVDTGLTMNFLKETLGARRPQSLTTVSLLEKPDALKVPCEVDFVGFKIPNDFVVGYGLDYNGQYRHLPYIARIESLN